MSEEREVRDMKSAKKEMEKAFTIVIIIVFIFFMGLCFLISKFFSKPAVSYDSMDDIMVYNTESTEIARIEIVDTYTLAGENYYIFTTDLTGSEKFTLSESEYEEIIGAGNNAVECIVYELQIESNIYSYEYSVFPKHKLSDISDVAWIVSNCGYDEAFRNFAGLKSNEPVEKAYYLPDSTILKLPNYTGRDNNTFYLYLEDNKNDNLVSLTSHLKVYKYSFLGESNFTEEEISKYKGLVDDISTRIAKGCK